MAKVKIVKSSNLLEELNNMGDEEEVVMVDEAVPSMEDAVESAEMAEEPYKDVDKEEKEQEAAMEKSIRQLVLLEQVTDAHKETSTNWWNDLVRDVMDESNPRQYFSIYERLYKKLAGATAMPATYRSAKTTIIKALDAGVEMWDASENKAFGKTNVTKRTAKAKLATPTSSPEEQAWDKIKTAIDVIITNAKLLGKSRNADLMIRLAKMVTEI